MASPKNFFRACPRPNLYCLPFSFPPIFPSDFIPVNFLPPPLSPALLGGSRKKFLTPKKILRSRTRRLTQTPREYLRPSRVILIRACARMSVILPACAVCWLARWLGYPPPRALPLPLSDRAQRVGPGRTRSQMRRRSILRARLRLLLVCLFMPPVVPQTGYFAQKLPQNFGQK